MKAFVLVNSQDLRNHEELDKKLRGIAKFIHVRDDHHAYLPDDGKLMEFICILLDLNIVYKLRFEPITVIHEN